MRIISIGPYFDYQIQLANSLSKRETVMLVLSKYFFNEAYFGSIDKRVEVRFLEDKTPVFLLTTIKLVLNFIKIVDEFKPDVIHMQIGGTLFDLILLQYFKNIPLVSTFHDPIIHLGEPKSLLGRLIIFRHRIYSNQYIVHGTFLKNQLINKYNIRMNKIHSMPIGEHEVAPFKRYMKPDLNEDGNVILFFGRIWEYKGLDYLIRAEPLITREVPDAKIIIAGAGEDFTKYEMMMQNRSNFIIYNYRIPYNEGAELFQRCSLVVLPYIEASQSGVIPTAYGFKKPVVVTSVGSIPEIVDDGITGFIVSPKDVRALADAIVRLLKDNELRRKMGENGYKKLKMDLSWDNIAKQTIQVYEEAIRGKKCK